MRTLVLATLVSCAVGPAFADADADRARRITAGALTQVLAGYQALQRGEDAAAVRVWMPVATVAPHRVQYLLASLLLSGSAGAHDPAAAIAFLREPAEHGHAEGEYWLGRAYQLGGDRANAMRWLAAACAQHFIEAEVALGTLYEETGAFADAARWYGEAASAGHARAQNNLGVLYADGRVAVTTDNDAERWFGEAARQGLADAQFNLGSLYEQGRAGARRDDVDAFVWFTRAARQGHTQAREMANVVAARLSESERAAAELRLTVR